MCFRPLPGNSIYQHAQIYQKSVKGVVSVPFRGTLSINLSFSHSIRQTDSVSVPFRGSLSINNGKAYLKERIKGFRPLPGISIYQL